LAALLLLLPRGENEGSTTSQAIQLVSYTPLGSISKYDVDRKRIVRKRHVGHSVPHLRDELASIMLP
jgi:hypothetical protein